MIVIPNQNKSMSYEIKNIQSKLTSEFKNNPPYHIEALYFITQNLTGSVKTENISKLIGHLKGKKGSEENALILLKDCFTLMAKHDRTFECYLEHFPGGVEYRGEAPPLVPGGGRSEGGATYIPKQIHKVKSGNIDERMSDAYLLELYDCFDVAMLEDFAVLGLRMDKVKFNNTISGASSAKEKLGRITSLWQQLAPTDNMQLWSDKKMPPCTKRGLRIALEASKLRGVISELKLT